MRSTRRWRCSRSPSSAPSPTSFAPALSCIARSFGEGGRGGPFKAYEWNKMKTPTRILVGGAGGDVGVRSVRARACAAGHEDGGPVAEHAPGHRHLTIFGSSFVDHSARSSMSLSVTVITPVAPSIATWPKNCILGRGRQVHALLLARRLDVHELRAEGVVELVRGRSSRHGSGRTRTPRTARSPGTPPCSDRSNAPRCNARRR